MVIKGEANKSKFWVFMKLVSLKLCPVVILFMMSLASQQIFMDSRPSTLAVCLKLADSRPSELTG